MNEKVSIVLPVYNSAKHLDYLKQSINSCLNQTHSDIELIIVDDGSTDNTIEIISSFKDKRIKLIKHKKNLGLPTALNSGFAVALGEYFSWTSDDNFYEKNAIQKMLSFLKEKNAEFVYSNINEVNSEKNFVGPVLYSEPEKLKEINVVGSCFLYSKKVKDTIGEYAPETILVEDYDFWLRVSKKFCLVHLPELLYNARVHNQSLSSTKYFDVRITESLVKIKNQVSNSKKESSFFAQTLAIKNNLFFPLNKLVFFFHRKKLKKAEKVFSEFENKKISFSKAKTELKKLLD